jgi:WhiB family redox-sensing transcriptional regulator
MSAGRARLAGPEAAVVAVIGTWLSLAAGGALACGTSPDLFFAESPLDVARAKELCAGCPVRAACLAEALDRGEPWGVWGGELLLRGAIVPTKRARGRPRKSELAA